MSAIPFPTSDGSLAHHLRRSLIESGAAKPAGLTFGDFIQACRELGFTDETPLAFVEYGIKQGGLNFLVREVEDDEIGIREL